MPWARVRAIMLQILAALSAAHEQQIIHRDMKPDNCFRISRIGNPDYIKVLDFGIAKVNSDEVDNETLTRTGTVLGTAHYMSPEQAKSERIDARADLYSAGIIMVELLTNRVPFHAPGFLGVLAKHITQPVPTMAELAPDVVVHPEVERIVRRALAKDPAARFQDAASFAEALRELGEDLDQGRGRSAWSVGVGVGVGTLAVVLGGLWLARERGAREGASDDDAAVALATAGSETDAATEADASATQTQTEPPVLGPPAPEPAEVEGEGAAASEPAPAKSEPKPGARPKREPEPASSKPEPEPEPEPEVMVELSDAAMAKGVSAIEVAAKACGAEHSALTSTVKISYTIDPSGKASAKAAGTDRGTPLGSCVARAFAEQTFPASQRGRSDTLSLPVR